ncbi:MAG: hypothetical protein ABEH81_01190 [Halopenitus sp.]
MTEEEYPHWKAVLLSKEKVWNAYCTIKYVIWHGLHAIHAVIVGVVMLLAVILERMFGFSISEIVSDKLDHPAILKTAKSVAMLFFLLSIGVFLVAVAAFFYVLYQNPLETGIGIVGIIVYFAVGFALLKLNRIYGKPIRSKAKTTPVVRRIYGQCPVSMEIEPKWYQKFRERIER